MAVTTISQLSASNRIPRLRRFSHPFRVHGRKLSISMSLERCGIDCIGSNTKNVLRYAAKASKWRVGDASRSYPVDHDSGTGKVEVGEPVQEQGVNQMKRTAKIHDFCLGIPFGAIVLSGGIIGFIISHNPASLSAGVLFGGAILFLSTFSLKIWRHGKSSFPFILGQAALSGALLWKSSQTYSLSKKIFPAGFIAILCAAMTFFYIYVLVSGGNPPPKKLKSSVSIAT